MTPDEAHRPERFLLRAATTLLSEQNREDAASFNLFTVLRSRSDEENLHSRFLHALLDQRTEGQRKNLEAFLKLQCLELPEGMTISSETAEVHREKRDIDLLIVDERCALVIENKIYAADQPKQLERYYNDPELKSFHRHVIYLTLDGHDPTEDSRGTVQDEHLSCVSYRDLLPWLEQCYDVANEDPALRNSISQYRCLIRELTGSGLGGEQVQQLKEVVRETRSLVLARNLGKAADEVLVDVVHDVWHQIDSAIRQEFAQDNLRASTPTDTNPELIKQAFGLSAKKRGLQTWHGLYYPFKKQENGHRLGPAPALGVELDQREFYFGVRCLRADRDGATPVKGAYDAITKAVGDPPPGFEQPDGRWWPCWRYVWPECKHLTDEQVAKLAATEAQEFLAKEIVEDLRKLWNELKKDPSMQHFF